MPRRLLFQADFYLFQPTTEARVNCFTGITEYKIFKLTCALYLFQAGLPCCSLFHWPKNIRPEGKVRKNIGTDKMIATF